MKLHPDTPGAPVISGHGPGWISLGGERITHSVIIGAHGERLPWPCASFDEIRPSHFEQLAALTCELVLFGCGQRLRFAPTHWLRPLIERGIGLETMDTAAACRTYNILAAEGRHVLAALLLENAALKS